MKDGNRVFYYHNYVDLFDSPEGFKLQLYWCNRIKGQHMYEYYLTDHAFVEFDSIIATTSLSYDARNGTYKLEERDRKFF